MQVTIRKFRKTDIPKKVEWINDPRNNRYLHYDLPLEVEKTEAWFEKNQDSPSRYDAVIEANGIPCGLIGLLGIDTKNSKAEYYISMGEQSCKGKGIASRASQLLLEYAFQTLKLNRVYMYTEAENVAAQKLAERVGFRLEGKLTDDLFSRGKWVDRYIYGVSRSTYSGAVQDAVVQNVPIQNLGDLENNHLFIMRDDLFPYSFGGNKARKAELFFREIDNGNYDCVVTYGSGSSNHCRVVANMAAQRCMPCYIISPEEASETTFNTRIIRRFGAQITVCPVSYVKETIDSMLEKLKAKGHRPYFIAGGGHGNTGTQAYVNCYREIRKYELDHHVRFDYIFHASGTGTTQSGLICGQLLHGDERKIIGISIARKAPRGRDVVVQSVREYLASCSGCGISDAQMEQATIFDDSYIRGGYGVRSPQVDAVIDTMMTKQGIPMDPVYTAKAYAGMTEYIKEHGISGKNVLFIHTGGTPLYFDYLKDKK